MQKVTSSLKHGIKMPFSTRRQNMSNKLNRTRNNGKSLQAPGDRLSYNSAAAATSPRALQSAHRGVAMRGTRCAGASASVAAAHPPRRAAHAAAAAFAAALYRAGHHTSPQSERRCLKRNENETTNKADATEIECKCMHNVTNNQKIG